MKQKKLVSAGKVLAFFAMMFLFISLFASCVSTPSPVSDEYVGHYEGELIPSMGNTNSYKWTAEVRKNGKFVIEVNKQVSTGIIKENGKFSVRPKYSLFPTPTKYVGEIDKNSGNVTGVIKPTGLAALSGATLGSIAGKRSK